ncbi:D-glycerate dehydrogenase, variant 2 [Balamuthia mandrillaris]
MGKAALIRLGAHHGLAARSPLFSVSSQRLFSTTASAKPPVCITRRLLPEILSRVEEQCEVRHYWDEETIPVPPNTLREWVRDCQGVYCLLTEKISKDLLEEGKGLKVVSSMSVGVDHIDVEACKQRGVAVGHTPGVLTDSTADIAVALLFAATRRLGEGIDLVKKGQWKTWSPFFMASPFDVTGCTVGVVGLGRIGAAFAERMARGFRCKILYCGRQPKPLAANMIGTSAAAASAALTSTSASPSANIPEYVSFEELLQRSDVVSVHCPLTPDTRHMFNKHAFRQMKKHAVLINTSRGPVVDEAALYEALKDGLIAAAGLGSLWCPAPPLLVAVAFDY